MPGFLFFVAFVVTSCGTGVTPAANETDNMLVEADLPDSVSDTYTIAEDGNGPCCLNLYELTPFDVIDRIKRQDTTFGMAVIIYDSVPDNWVKPEHLPKLIELMKSEEPVYPVFTEIASISFFSHGFSTVGNEAHKMIQSFRKNGKYRGSLGNSLERGEIERLPRYEFDETMEWWKNYQADK